MKYPLPDVVGRDAFEAGIEKLRLREKALMKESDALAAQRRRLPVVRVDGSTPLVGATGPATLLEAFDGRSTLITYYFMWHNGLPALQQCEGCTWVTSQVQELAFIHQRDATFAVFCQGPFEQSIRYRDFMGWTMPWYSAEASLPALLGARRFNMMYIICYVRDGDDVYETYWTTRRGVEAMDNNYRLLDLTLYGRQETWEVSPPGWPQPFAGKDHFRVGERPTPQWSRIEAGRSDALVGPDR